MTKEKKFDLYEHVTNLIITELQKGNIPWRKPWAGGADAPKNFISKKAYRGLNIFLLTMRGYACPYWVTYKQAKDKGGQVKKGEHGAKVIFWKMLKKDEKDSNGNQVYDDKGNKKEKNIPLLRYYTLFNLEQCEGIDWEKPEKPLNDFSPIESAEKIVKGFKDIPEIRFNEQRAYYAPLCDYINMPKKESFTSNGEYYSTLFHELAHSTGHKNRLNRSEVMDNNFFGSHDYSQEELTAEMAACFLNAHCGILNPPVLENNGAYIKSWIKKLSDDKKALVYASARAQKASDYILGENKKAEK
jgi:antirestriction protein ArdC